MAVFRLDSRVGMYCFSVNTERPQETTGIRDRLQTPAVHMAPGASRGDEEAQGEGEFMLLYECQLSLSSSNIQETVRFINCVKHLEFGSVLPLSKHVHDCRTNYSLQHPARLCVHPRTRPRPRDPPCRPPSRA